MIRKLFISRVWGKKRDKIKQKYREVEEEERNSIITHYRVMMNKK